MRDKKQSKFGSPARLFDIVLKYAITSGAHEIKIEPRDDLPAQESSDFPGGAGSVVSMRRGKEWRDAIGLLQRDYPALLACLRELASMDDAQNSGDFTLDFRDAKTGLHLAYEVKVKIAENGAATLHFAEKHDTVLAAKEGEYSPLLFFP